jgi:hypothetical protein
MCSAKHEDSTRIVVQVSCGTTYYMVDLLEEKEASQALGREKKSVCDERKERALWHTKERLVTCECPQGPTEESGKGSGVKRQ